MQRMKTVESELRRAQVSELCRRRLLNYVDSFYELARSYDGTFCPETEDTMGYDCETEETLYDIMDMYMSYEGVLALMYWETVNSSELKRIFKICRKITTFPLIPQR